MNHIVIHKYHDILTYFVAFIVTLVSIQLLKPLAVRVGLVDSPGGRKDHLNDVPLIGGIAMFIGICFAFLTLNMSLLPYRSFIASLAVLVFIGILDDLRELTAKARFLAQIAVALMMIFWGKNYIASFGNLLFIGNIHLSWFLVPVTIIAVVGVINAVNMLDGIDGLAGGLILQQLMVLIFLAYQGNLIDDTKILFIFVSALSGFLIFNMHWPQYLRMKIFMGDAGSTLLGFIMVWFLISLSQGANRVATPVTMLWIMAVPLFDTLRVIIMRIRQGKSPLTPGRDHIHHYLLHKGIKPWQINIVIISFNLICAACGIAGQYWHVPEGIMFISFLASFYLFFLQFNVKQLKSRGEIRT